MKNPLQVLFLASWYPNRVMPTLGNFIQKHAEAVSMYASVTALFVCGDNKCVNNIEVVECVNKNVYTVNVYYRLKKNKIPFISTIQRWWLHFHAWKKGLEIVKNKMVAVDIVHHNVLYPVGLVAVYLKWKWKCPLMVSEHWTGYLPEKKFKFGLIQLTLSKFIARKADYITPVSCRLKNAMLELGLKAVYEIVYNVVDTKIFSLKQPVKTKKKTRFLHVSTLDDDQKNVSGILQALNELALIHDDFECVIIGDGDCQPHIRKAAELNIYNKIVFFEGMKTTAEIAHSMQQADCFLLFSNYENLPVVLVEAMACGLPVITTNVGGITEHVSEDKGLLLNPRDVNALKQAMITMMDNLALNQYDANKIRAYAERNFSYENVGQKFFQLYNKMLSNHA
jgi:glycosyltransferase involved in cell wall biosynthesis